MSTDVKKPRDGKDALTFTSPNFVESEYAKTAQLAKLRDIKLINSAYTVKPKLLELIAAKADLKHSFSGEVSSPRFDKSDGFLFGFYGWEAEIKSGRQKMLSVKAEYILAYSGLESASEDYVYLYFKKLARFTTYPFFRAHFAVLTSETGLSLPPLPSLADRVD